MAEAIAVGSTLLVAAGTSALVGGGKVAVDGGSVFVGVGGGVLVGGTAVEVVVGAGGGVSLGAGFMALGGLGKFGVICGNQRDCPTEMAVEVRQFAYMSCSTVMP